MNITKVQVREFEWQQKNFGTKTALDNLLFEVANNMLKANGASRVTVRYRQPNAHHITGRYFPGKVPGKTKKGK